MNWSDPTIFLASKENVALIAGIIAGNKAGDEYDLSHGLYAGDDTAWNRRARKRVVRKAEAAARKAYLETEHFPEG